MRAFLFPGQGTQFVGMGVALARAFPEAAEVLALADEVLGLPLSRIMAEGPPARLMETDITQPAVLAYSLALLAVLRARGLRPDATAGYSLGEYGALVAAEVLDPATALGLVRERALAMVQARPLSTRSMLLVVGPPPEVLAEWCDRCPPGEVLAIAGFLTPTMHSLSGSEGGLDWLEARVEAGELHAQLRPVPVTLPFHCSLLAGAQPTLRARLAAADLRPARCPVLFNVDGEPETRPDRCRELLVAQVVRPVQWVKTVGSLRRLGVDEVWEVGPGRSLGGYLKRIDPALGRVQVEDAPSLQALLERLSAG